MKWSIAAMVGGFAARVLCAPWPADLIARKHYVGGSGGNDFSFIAEEGETVDRIRIYKSGNLVGLRIYFSDGTENAIGNTDAESKEYKFDPSVSEQIKTLSLWGNGVGTRSGRIKFETTNGGSFDWGQDTSGQSEYPIDIGSGILVGLEGKAEKQIDKLAFIFLAPLAKVYYDDLKYTNFDARAGLTTKSLDEQIVRYSGVNATHLFTSTRLFEGSRTFTKSISSTLGFGAKYSAGVPEVAQVELSASWSITGTLESAKTEKWQRNIGWSVTIIVDSPAKEAVCTAKISEGKLDLEWTGTLNMIFDAGDGVEGFHWKGPARGRLDNIDSSKIEASCKRLSDNMPIEAVPAGTQPINTQPGNNRTFIGGGAARAPVRLH
ncbi:hypothetical protein MN608_11473 [Microdochium nivale]|nr:hypothetical protein MN608_11473 [Microdochium nivale]